MKKVSFDAQSLMRRSQLKTVAKVDTKSQIRTSQYDQRPYKHSIEDALIAHVVPSSLFSSGNPHYKRLVGRFLRFNFGNEQEIS